MASQGASRPSPIARRESTIAALSSPAGGAERAVVRLSGPRSATLARKIAPVPKRRGVRHTQGRIQGATFPCSVWFMPAPRSYTREDVVEIHVPGAPPLARAAMDALLDAGARAAEPGEFTRRAFQSGRIDLAQAEAVLSVIRAEADSELSAAASLLQGRFSKAVGSIEDRLTSLAADIEASIDFVDQDIDLLPSKVGLDRVDRIQRDLTSLLSQSRSAEIAADAPTAFLVGPPNAGKSTLFNALTGGKALTSGVPGTTRDLLEGSVEGVRLFDAPGIGETGGPLLDREAARRAHEAMKHADLWVVVVDGANPRPIALESTRPRITVVTKADLAPAPAADALAVSAVTGAGLDDLRARLRDWTGSEGPGSRFSLSRRQLALLRQARRALDGAAYSFKSGSSPEFAALDAREALDAIGGITGKRADEEILDRIFSRFCLGK
ncbi:MAG TPA: tRNA modification GTPase [Planctomycetota bacterium]|nr:tRNA modification GTPase [Planctomycetota bacterium]